MMISDEGALEDMVFTHRYFRSEEQAAVSAFRQGVNIELGPNTKLTIYSFLKAAYDKGLVSKQLLVQRARDLFRVRMRLGEFDPPQMVPFNYCMRRSATASMLSFAILVWDNAFVYMRYG